MLKRGIDIKKYEGNITIEMSLIFPIIIVIIATMIMCSFYRSDLVSIRAVLYKYDIYGKGTDEIKNEIYNEICSSVIVAKPRDVVVGNGEEECEIIAKIGYSQGFFNISRDDVIKVKKYQLDNHKFIIKEKVVADTIIRIKEK